MVGALLVGIIGFCQIAAGVALMVVSGLLLTQIGKALISEGVSDLIYSAKAFFTGEFDWKDYLISKALSVLVAFTCIGISYCASLNPKTLLGRTVRNIARFITGGKGSAATQVVKGVANTSLKKGLSIAMRYAGFVLATSAFKAMVGELTSYAAKEFLQKELKDRIQKSFNEKCRAEILDNEHLVLGIKIDNTQRETNHYQSVFISHGDTALKPTDKEKAAWKAFDTGKGILEGAAEGKGRKALLNFAGYAIKIIDLSKKCVCFTETYLEILSQYDEELKEKWKKINPSEGSRPQLPSISEDNKGTDDPLEEELSLASSLEGEIEYGPTPVSKDRTKPSEHKSSKSKTPLPPQIQGDPFRPSSQNKVLDGVELKFGEFFSGQVIEKIFKPIADLLTSKAIDKVSKEAIEETEKELKEWKQSRELQKESSTTVNPSPNCEAALADMNLMGEESRVQLIEEQSCTGVGSMNHVRALAKSMDYKMTVYTENGSVLAIYGHDKNSGKSVSIQETSYVDSDGKTKSGWNTTHNLAGKYSDKGSDLFSAVGSATGCSTEQVRYMAAKEIERDSEFSCSTQKIINYVREEDD